MCVAGIEFGFYVYLDTYVYFKEIRIEYIIIYVFKIISENNLLIFIKQTIYLK